MIVALRSGVPPDAWLEDTHALATAVQILTEWDRR